MSRKKSPGSFSRAIALATLLLFALPAAASALVVPLPGGCDYSAADQNDGWGWNPSTSESCAPLEEDRPNNDIYVSGSVVECRAYETGNNYGAPGSAGDYYSIDVACFLNGTQVSERFDGCDYRDASQNGGWGWNPDTSESCQPAR